jgi:ABC-type oligopeptide transport system substrate-binding subunit
VSAGGRVYTFRIRAGYRFSPPSGRPVTAAAFQRAIERALHPRTASYGAYYLGDVLGAAAYRARRAGTVAGVSARGDRLTIRLARASPTLPAAMATFSLCAVPPNMPIRPRGLERVATAGPYYVAEAEPDKRLLLRRNPGYPGPRPRHHRGHVRHNADPRGRRGRGRARGLCATGAVRRPGAADRPLRARQPCRGVVFWPNPTSL